MNKMAEDIPKVNDLRQSISEKESDRLSHIADFNKMGFPNIAASIGSAGRFVPLCGSFKYEATRLLQLISKTTPLVGSDVAHGRTWSSVNLTYPETIQKQRKLISEKVEAVVVEKKDRTPGLRTTLLIYVPSEMQFRSFVFQLSKDGNRVNEPAIGQIIHVEPLNPDSLFGANLATLNERVGTKDVTDLDDIDKDRVYRTLCLLKNEEECSRSVGCEWVADSDFAMAMRYWPLKNAEVQKVLENELNLIEKWRGNYKEPPSSEMLKLGVRFYEDGMARMGSRVPSGACTLKKDVTKLHVDAGGFWQRGRGNVNIPQFVLSPGISMSRKDWEGGAATIFEGIDVRDGKTIPNRDGGAVSLCFRGTTSPPARQTLREFVWMFEPYLSADSRYATDYLQNLMNSSMFEKDLKADNWSEIHMLSVIWEHVMNPDKKVHKEFVAQTLFNLHLDGDPYLPPGFSNRNGVESFLKTIVLDREEKFHRAHHDAVASNRREAMHFLNNYWGDAGPLGELIDVILSNPAEKEKLKTAWCKRCLRIFRNGESKYTKTTTTRNSSRVVVNKIAFSIALANLISSTPLAPRLRQWMLNANIVEGGTFDWYQTSLTFTGFGLGGAFAQIAAMIVDLTGFPFLGARLGTRRPVLEKEGIDKSDKFLLSMPVVTQMFSFGANRVGNMGFAQYFGLRNLHGETFNVFRQTIHLRNTKAVRGEYPLSTGSPVIAVDPRNGALFNGTCEGNH